MKVIIKALGNDVGMTPRTMRTVTLKFSVTY